MFWLTSLQVLMQKFEASRDAILSGPAVVRGIPAQNWTACIYDFYRNITVRANLYFSDRTWLSPYLPPNSQVPIRIEYTGRQNNASHVTDISLIGDISSLKRRNPDETFPPDTFTTQAGAFCPNRTGVSIRFPGFPPGLSLLMEVIDIDFSRITYEELWYDSTVKMARLDSKLTFGEDSNPFSYIFDFHSGIKYIIDKYMMTCSVSRVAIGDDFTEMLANGSLSIASVDTFFRSHNANIQYAGQETVRDVTCDTWIGRYFDPSANLNTTVQWYFTARKWTEATGNVEGGGAFFMMKVWKGGSGSPTIYNVMKYSPIAPDFSAFDFAVCYKYDAKKHFTIEFQVSNMEGMAQLSLSYLRLILIRELAMRIKMELNRFTDVTLDADTINSSLFMSGTLLGLIQGSQHPLVPLDVGFRFLQESIDASHLAFNVSLPISYTTLTGISLVEHNFRKQFATSTSTLPPTTRIVAPTLVPPKKRTPAITKESQTTTIPNHLTCPPAPLCNCTTVKPSCPPVISCPSCPTTPLPCPSQTLLPTRWNCPPTHVSPTPQPCTCPTSTPSDRGRTSCPPPVPCPTRKTGTSKAAPHSCECPSTPAPCRQGQTSSGSNVSTAQRECPAGRVSSLFWFFYFQRQGSGTWLAAALASGIVAALILGLALGIISTRLYHVNRIKTNQMTINLIEDNI